MRRLNDEGGAVAVIMAIAVLGLVGMGALVIDVGAMYYEVRELQNGADAAALAVAQDCAGGDCGSYQDTATQFTNANANDGSSDAAVQLPGLDGSNSVTVTAATLTAAGEGFLTHRLGNVLGIPSSTFARQATAIWGNVGGGTTIPIAICEHAWKHYTADGTVLPSGPPAHLLRFSVPPGHANELDDCTGPSGDTYPGGFAFLQRNDDCTAPTTQDDMAEGVSGDHPGSHSGCPHSTLYAGWRLIIDDGGSVLIPIFDYHVGNGSNGQFHIVGYGGFKFEGFSINGGPGTPSQRRYQMSSSECPGGASCLKGYFTEFISIDALPSYGGPDFGATAVALTR